MANLFARFDHDLLDSQTRQLVGERTAEIKGLVKRLGKATVDIGQKLLEVKHLLPHGLFGDWIREEFDWSADTAERMMNVARWASQNPQIAEFGIGQSALYLLAKPSTPESARQEAIERACEGETISYRKAKAIVKAHKHSDRETFTIRSQPTAQEPSLPSPDSVYAFGRWMDRIHNEAMTFQSRARTGDLAASLNTSQRQKLGELIEFLSGVDGFDNDWQPAQRRESMQQLINSVFREVDD